MTTTDDRARLSRALNDIDLRIHSRLSFDQIMQAALDGFVTALRADAGDIKVFDGSEWVVRYEHGFGPKEVGTRLTIWDAPVATKVAQLREPVTVADYLDEPADFYVGFPRMHQLRATLAVPLIIREEVAGCLFAWMRHEPRGFTSAETDFGRRIAASVALALENARLLESEQAARRRAESAERRLEEELDRTRILLRASDELTTTTDSDELLSRLANVVLDATGISRAFVNLIDTRREVLVPKVATGGLIAPTGREIPFSRLSETARQAIAEKKVALLDYERRGLPDTDRAIAEANSSRLILFVPLLSQGEIIGHISLDEPGERYEFGAEQIRIVESIAAQAAVALQNAQSYEREHRIAETLQQAILTPPEEVAALDIAYLYEPASAAANVGGDFYDVVDLGDCRVALLIGDVAGKGIDAARLTTLVRDGARAYLFEDGDPSVVLAKLNALTYRFTPKDKFVTAFLGILDCSSGELHYCSAGHPPPAVRQHDRAFALESEPGLLGAFAHAGFQTLCTRLSDEQALVLFTDGLTEARREGAMFGEEGVLEALKHLGEVPVTELPTRLLAEVLAFAEGHLRDDVVILCVARKPRAGVPW